MNTSDFVTANEGDGREFGEDEDAADYYTDEIRVEDLAVALGYDATVAPFDEANLGRLKVGENKISPFQIPSTEILDSGFWNLESRVLNQHNKRGYLFPTIPFLCGSATIGLGCSTCVSSRHDTVHISLGSS